MVVVALMVPVPFTVMVSFEAPTPLESPSPSSKVPDWISSEPPSSETQTRLLILVVEVPSRTRPLEAVMESMVVDWFAVMVVALPARMSGEAIVRSPASTVMAWAEVPSMVRLPPEMPTALVVLIVREAMVWSPPRLVAVSFEEPVAEKTMSESDAKFSVGVPVALLDQLLAAVQESPSEPSQ